MNALMSKMKIVKEKTIDRLNAYWHSLADFASKVYGRDWGDTILSRVTGDRGIYPIAFRIAIEPAALKCRRWKLTNSHPLQLSRPVLWGRSSQFVSQIWGFKEGMIGIFFWLNPGYKRPAY